MSHYLAIDLGAESGRGILGTLSDGRLTLEEVHRFLNEPVRLPGGLYWDSFRLFYNVCESLRVVGRERKVALAGIGVDTWGVDFGVVGEDGALTDNPRCYRDARTAGMFEKLFSVVPKTRVFAESGLQFMELNSLYQLYAMKLAGSPGLGVASHLLFMPDLLAYWLTGVMKN
ncbi:MAG: rhamnulokinase, partial [Bryobacteraceae bacterium]